MWIDSNLRLNYLSKTVNIVFEQTTPVLERDPDDVNKVIVKEQQIVELSALLMDFTCAKNLADELNRVLDSSSKPIEQENTL